MDLVLIGKAAAKYIGKAVVAKVKDKYQDLSMRRRVDSGADLVTEGTLRSIVQSEIQKLASKPGTIAATKSPKICEWISTQDFLDPFIWLLIASGNGQRTDDGLPHEFLAHQYADATGDDARTANGYISDIVGYVLGRLTLNKSQKDAFLQATTRLMAAGLQHYFRPELRPNPSGFDLYRLNSLAEAFIKSGRTTWGLPDFIAPFSLEALEVESEKESAIETPQILAEIQTRSRLVMMGEGGIGKTTFLLRLAAQCVEQKKSFVPLFIDASEWAQSNSEILTFSSNRTAAQMQHLSATDLAWFAKAGRIALFINGWNEIPSVLKPHAQSKLNEFLGAAPEVPVVVVSRSSNDAGNLSSAKLIRVRGITWNGQQEIIRKELGEETGHTLTELLERDILLAQAARSPLILRGLISQAKNGQQVSNVTLDLLGAVVQELEERAAYKAVLAAEPLYGYQTAYLQELAIEMNRQNTLRLSEREARAAMARGYERVKDEIGIQVPLPAVLDTLRNHHLIQLHGDMVKFAHHRFQEFYSATRLLELCQQSTEKDELLRHAVNEPYWTDALGMAAEKLRASDNVAKQKETLIRSALSIDLTYACDLAGNCGFAANEAPELHRELLSKIDELEKSTLTNVYELSTICQISSCFPEFADQLWQFLEDDNLQNRLHFLRSSGLPLSVNQLGVDALQRIQKWKPEIQAEFMHEIAKNPDNYEFLFSVVKTSPIQAVQIAAIYSLLWVYPTSLSVINLWKNSGKGVISDQSILSMISYSYEQGIGCDIIEARLNELCKEDMTDGDRLYLAIEFGSIIKEIPLDHLFESLAQSYSVTIDDPYFKLAQKNAPDRLRNLAARFCTDRKHPPPWVHSIVAELPPETMTAIFETTWAFIQDGKRENLKPKLVGPMTNDAQIATVVAELIDIAEMPRADRSAEIENKRRDIENLLAYVGGNLLWRNVIIEGGNASHEGALAAVELIWRRMNRENTPYEEINPWAPSPAQVETLISNFLQKTAETDNSSIKILIYLSLIASSVSPEQYGELIASSLQQYLDAQAAFLEAREKWRGPQDGNLPNGPPMSSELLSAIQNWGFAALPTLEKKMTHPAALEIVPAAIARVSMSQWIAVRKGVNSMLSSIIAEGQYRQSMQVAMQQPTDTHQKETDEIAVVLAARLEEELEKSKSDKADSYHKTRWSIGNLTRHVAAIPSAHTIKSVEAALTSGLMDSYRFADALKMLILGGWTFTSPAIFKALEKEIHEAEKTVGRQEQYHLSELFQLLFAVDSVDLLTQPIETYLLQWKNHTHPNEICRRIAESRKGHGWDILIKAYELFGGKELDRDQFACALTKALQPQHIKSLITQIENGRFFEWFKANSHIDGIADAIALQTRANFDDEKLIKSSFRAAGTAAADYFEYELLKVLGEDDEILAFGLAAVDAGRANKTSSSAFRALLSLSTAEEYVTAQVRNIHPRNCNVLRKALLERAQEVGPATVAARQILARLESYRREGGRPNDESRHPAPEQGTAWTDALLQPELT